MQSTVMCTLLVFSTAFSLIASQSPISWLISLPRVPDLIQVWHCSCREAVGSLQVEPLHGNELKTDTYMHDGCVQGLTPDMCQLASFLLAHLRFNTTMSLHLVCGHDQRKADRQYEKCGVRQSQRLQDKTRLLPLHKLYQDSRYLCV